MENTTSSEIVQTHLQGLYKARQAFLQAESSERIRRALRHNVRSVNGRIEPGEKVFYQRDTKVWRGPGNDIGRDGTTYLVKHGGNVVRVHQARIRKVASGILKSDSNTTSGIARPDVQLENVAIDDFSEIRPHNTVGAANELVASKNDPDLNTLEPETTNRAKTIMAPNLRTIYSHASGPREVVQRHNKK